MELEEYVGKRFNHITVVGVSEKPYHLDYVCDCGKKGTVYKYDIEKRYSCGCMERRGDAYIGKRFGRLTVIERAKDPRKYVCKCNCGNTTIVGLNNLLGNTNSCGCLNKELSAERGKSKNCELLNKYLGKAREKNCVNGWNAGLALSDKLPKNNTSGVKGVCYISKGNRWVAYINLHGKRHYLGYFANKKDAIAARKRAEEKRLLMIMEDTE